MSARPRRGLMPFFDFDDHFLGQMEWANLNKGATKVNHSQCHILSQAKILFFLPGRGFLEIPIFPGRILFGGCYPLFFPHCCRKTMEKPLAAGRRYRCQASWSVAPGFEWLGRSPHRDPPGDPSCHRPQPAVARRSAEERMVTRGKTYRMI